MPLVPVCAKDGTWAALRADWHQQCAVFGEDLDNYAVGAFSILEPLAMDGHPKAEVYALHNGQDYDAVCQVNRTRLPDYDGHVLRVRFMTFAPKYDFGILSVDDYAKLLVNLFFGVLDLSLRKLSARHLKFHLRSPADSQFFAALRAPLTKHKAFELVEVRGMWLYVTRSK